MKQIQFSIAIELDPELMERDYVELAIRQFIEGFCSDAEMELLEFKVSDNFTAK